MSIAVRPEAPAAEPVDFAAAARPAVDAGQPVRIQVGDSVCEVTGQLAVAVVGLLGLVGTGQPVDITALPVDLTTGQAADVLGVSRPTVVALIDKGLLPATRVGTHRRVHTADALAYRDQARKTRREALDELTEVSEELGLYDS
jgi:excisionase family DNA binding protein